MASSSVLNKFINKLLHLYHKNLLLPSDTFKTKEFIYAVYEYSKLDNLQNYLQRKGKLTQEDCLSISRQIIDGYKFIKGKGLIHGNIKPTNILVDESDHLTIKLTDFLLCHSKKKDLSKDKFIAPEIASKEKDPNIISDIYSIGAIMQLLLESTEISTDICTTLIKDCLQTDPDKRIKFDVLTLHPYFTSTYPVYKLFNGNLLIILDYFYICTCLKRGDVALTCKDYFCPECIEKLIHNKKLNERNSQHIWAKIKIQCPKCLMTSGISN